jgi:hypothetical protein
MKDLFVERVKPPERGRVEYFTRDRCLAQRRSLQGLGAVGLQDLPDNNKYSVAASAVGRPVEVHAYADRVVIRQDGRVVSEHQRSFGRGGTFYDPWHYVPVLARKPGARAGSRARLVGDCDWRWETGSRRSTGY